MSPRRNRAADHHQADGPAHRDRLPGAGDGHGRPRAVRVGVAVAPADGGHGLARPPDARLPRALARRAERARVVPLVSPVAGLARTGAICSRRSRSRRRRSRSRDRSSTSRRSPDASSSDSSPKGSSSWASAAVRCASPPGRSALVGRNLRDVVIVGDGSVALETATRLAQREALGYRVVEVLSLSETSDRATRERQSAALLARVGELLNEKADRRRSSSPPRSTRRSLSYVP